jgi:aminomethyltransferase
MGWKDWSGYYAVTSYLHTHDMEYFAFRYSAGLLDVTPLFKYTVTGPDAERFLSRIMVRDITKLKVGRVAYLCWCTDEGKVVDDGTVMRRGEHDFFITSADPCFSWFSRFAAGYQVDIEEVTDRVAGLALQGPTSRDILKQVCDADLDRLRFFRTVETAIENNPVWISRTGYTGDLGYELWMSNEAALQVWDALMSAGHIYGIRPAGLDALDVSRMEAGLILKGVDYFNALHVLIDGRKSSPYELSLGWAVHLDREPFNGQEALRQEKSTGSEWTFMGLDIDWPETEALFARHGLPPEVSTHAWRMSIPVYADKSRKNQVGYATSGTWSPILKKNLALATLKSDFGKIGTKLQFEMTVEHQRFTVPATVCDPQFYDPPQKKSILSSDSVKSQVR